jgi:nicotinate-nucleotide adenylyltransferase
VSDRCLLLLGGSFDPVHEGHIALARYFGTLLHPDELRLIPAGQPWQKPGMSTPAADRIAMLQLAFADWAVPVVIDAQEIRRNGPSYAIDTLRALRADVGDNTSLVMALGADQLLNLHTWRDWQQLFAVAHLCFAARPDFDLRSAELDPEVGAQLAKRLASPSQLRDAPHGLAFVASNLAVAVSSTAIRAALGQNATGLAANALSGWLPGAVLDYIRHHHLYQTR